MSCVLDSISDMEILFAKILWVEPTFFVPEERITYEFHCSFNNLKNECLGQFYCVDRQQFDDPKEKLIQLQQIFKEFNERMISLMKYHRFIPS